MDPIENDAAEVHTLVRLRNELQDEVAEILNSDVLAQHLVARERDIVESEPAALARAVSLLRKQLEALPKDSQQATDDKTTRSKKEPTNDLVKFARSTDVAQWTPAQLFELNRLLLEESYPQVFSPRSEIRRRITHTADQKSRLTWCALSLLVFLGVGLWVDLNATSMHRFYRTCLAQAFIVPQRNKASSPALSELSTTQHGAPYHLMSASMGLTLDRTGKEDIPAGISFEQGRQLDFRAVDSFVFSQLFCGSQVTGYVRTEDYEKWIRGDDSRLDLAEATAISGAAVSPGQVPNWLLAFLMFAMNLRLGQWLPNPRIGPPRLRPSILNLIWNLPRLPRDRDYCFVTDGGNSENLGLVQLLRRRCRLIIQVDAGHDPDHAYGDLARALRTARIHGGIHFVSLEKPDADFCTEPLDLRELVAGSADNEGIGRGCGRHFLAARILYPDGTKGLFLYIKPSFTGDESPDLIQYRKQNKHFPHESTSDQVYDHSQVESYRQLGYHIGMSLCGALPLDSGTDLWEGEAIDTERLCDWFEQAVLKEAATSGPAEQLDSAPPSAAPVESGAQVIEDSQGTAVVVSRAAPESPQTPGSQAHQTPQPVPRNDNDTVAGDGDSGGEARLTSATDGVVNAEPDLVDSSTATKTVGWQTVPDVDPRPTLVDGEWGAKEREVVQLLVSERTDELERLPYAVAALCRIAQQASEKRDRRRAVNELGYRYLRKADVRQQVRECLRRVAEQDGSRSLRKRAQTLLSGKNPPK